MKWINQTKSVNPYYNLALEEYILKNRTDDVFLLWQNDNTIVIGRNQNTLEEINLDYVKEQNITVARRMSGGGAVYHDLGNLNFSFAVQNRENQYFDFAKFAAPVIALLDELGVKAELSGRNDLTIDGKKISGNAQYSYHDRILHHGTLLFSSDMTRIANALRVSEQKIESKGIKSVQSRVANIADFLPVPMGLDEFRRRFLAFMCAQNPDMEEYQFADAELEEIEALCRSKYSTWEWNYGYSPKYTFRKSKKFPSGLVHVELDAADSGIIQNVKFYGDYFSKRDVSEVEEKLRGVAHRADAVASVLDGFSLEDYFHGISKEEILSLLF